VPVSPRTRAEQEQWRDVFGAVGILQVSDLGRVKRLSRAGNTGRKGNVGMVWTPPPPKNRVWVSGRGSIDIAVLVLEAFVGACPNGMECCHNDDNRSNNGLGNLRWDTHVNNVKDGYKNGAPRRRKHWRRRFMHEHHVNSTK
jgi:hypothetical protein